MYFICHPKAKLRDWLDPSIKIKAVNLGKISLLKPIKSFLNTDLIPPDCGKLILNNSADLKNFAINAYIRGVPDIIYRRGIDLKPTNNLLNQFMFNVVISRFITNSKQTQKSLFVHVGSASENLDVTTIYNGLELDSFFVNGKDRKKEDDETFIIGNTCRIVEQKGHIYLLEVAEILIRKGLSFKIKIAGIGPDLKYLQDLCKKKGLEEYIEFLGFVSDIPKFLSGISVFALSSKFEGFCFSICEAMAASKPVVAFDVSSNPEIISDKETGYLIPPFDCEAFADRIFQLAKDRDQRLQFGRNGFRRTHSLFHQKKQDEKLLNFLYPGPTEVVI